MNPHLTVVVAAFNAGETLGRSIASARSIAADVLVVDDGSTDGTADLGRLLGARVVSISNSGAAAARRLGLSMVTSEFCAVLDADDELVVEGVAESIRLLEADPSIAIAAGRVIGVRPDGTEGLLDRRYARVDPRTLLDTGYGPWPPAAAVMRMSAYLDQDRLGIPMLDTSFAEDYELVIRMSLVGRIATHESISARYWLFAGKSSRAPMGALVDKERIRAYYAELLGIPTTLMTHRQIKAAAHLRALQADVANGRIVPALVQASRAAVASPSWIVDRARERVQIRRHRLRTRRVQA